MAWDQQNQPDPSRQWDPCQYEDSEPSQSMSDEDYFTLSLPQSFLRQKDPTPNPPPPHEYVNLLEKEASFIRKLERSEPKMRQIVGGLKKAAADLAGIILSVALTAVVFMIVKEVEKLGEDLMEIIEPQKSDLEEMKMTCEKLESQDVKDQRIQSDVSKRRNRYDSALAVTQNLIAANIAMQVDAVNVSANAAAPEELARSMMKVKQLAEKHGEKVTLTLTDATPRLVMDKASCSERSCTCSCGHKHYI